MKKNFSSFFLISILFLITPDYSAAQSGAWAFMKGDSTTGSFGHFGTQGVPAAANYPPALYEPCEWTDHDGNFWLFGGGYSYNSLWKYDATLNQWAWMKGLNNVNGPAVYGTQGVPDLNNTPGVHVAATSWVDHNNILWLYGGYDNIGGKNDLWKYDITTNEWTWIDGSSGINSLGIYGTKGVASATNDPGARLETAAAWVDDANDLWFFGGQLCCNASDYIDDVWRYNSASGEWTWMQGVSVGVPPVYGTMGVVDSANTPGGRRVYAHWKDADDNFWIFGGQGTSGNCYNDLWKYDHLTNQWTWMNGANGANSTGHYGVTCSFDSINEPPSRMENRFYWTDSCFNFWMFGGINTFNGNYFNDLWCYSPALNQWKWTSGSSIPDEDGLYGTAGIPSSSNHPGARYGGVGWLGSDETFWMFGGHGYPYNNNVGELNDLWLFIPDSSCVYCNPVFLPNTAFQSSDSSLCEKFCISFTDESVNNPTAWLWLFPGGDPASSTDQNPTNICYDIPGVYDVTLITTNASGNDTLTLPDFITVYSTPPFPVITQVGYTLTSTSATAYQWQLNSYNISGATNQSYTVLQSGYYTVLVSDSNGCSNSASIKVIISGIDEVGDANVFIFPNPSSGNFVVELSNGFIADDVSIDVVNTLGQKVFSSGRKNLPDGSQVSSFNREIEIDLTAVSKGVYFIEIRSNNIFHSSKIVITN